MSKVPAAQRCRHRWTCRADRPMRRAASGCVIAGCSWISRTRWNRCASRTEIVRRPAASRASCKKSSGKIHGVGFGPRIGGILLRSSYSNSLTKARENHDINCETDHLLPPLESADLSHRTLFSPRKNIPGRPAIPGVTCGPQFELASKPTCEYIPKPCPGRFRGRSRTLDAIGRIRVGWGEDALNYLHHSYHTGRRHAP